MAIKQQWGKQDKNYSPISETTKSLPAGLFQLRQSMFGFYLIEETISPQNIYETRSDITNKVCNEIKTFYKSKDKYDKMNLLHKRGYIFFGKPGVGKTTLIRQIIDFSIKEHNAVCIQVTDLEILPDFYSYFRTVEGERPLILILEDMEVIINSCNCINEFLNWVDGVSPISNVLLLGTTNYKERLEGRVIDRPGRFDSVYEVKPPEPKNKQEFLKNMLETTKITLTPTQRKCIIENTDGLSLAHIREVIVQMHVYGHNFDTIIKQINTNRSGDNGIDQSVVVRDKSPSQRRF